MVIELPRKTYRNVIVSDEILEKVNPENMKIVNRYLRNFDTKRSDKSVVVKRSDFNIFLCWNYLYNDNKLITDIKKIELLDYFDFGVTELGWGTARFNSMHSSLNTLFNYIVNFLDEIYPQFHNYMGSIEKPKKTFKREKTVLSEAQVESLIKYLSFDKKTLQQLTYLLLAIGSGMRISEVLQMQTDLIDESNLAFGDNFLKTTRKIRTKGFGKEGAPKYKYIYKDLFLPVYKEWLTVREEILKEKGLDHNYIFIKANGEPATSEVINYWLRKWEKYLSEDIETNPKLEPVDLYAHCFRHYIVTYLTRQGISKELIVAIIGWASDSMYDTYNDCEEDERQYIDLEKLGGVFK